MSRPLRPGMYTALVTPFESDGKIDWSAWQRLIERQLAAGVTGIVVAGTTGESPTLGIEEWQRLLSTAVQWCDDRCLVMVGTGCNATQKSQARHRRAEQSGADAGLVVTPYYNRPPQAGLIAHYQQVHDACHLPICAYNVPARTGVCLERESLRQLWQLPRLVAYKDATSFNQPTLTPQNFKAHYFASAEHLLLSGDDVSAVAYGLAGGDGVISVMANLMPKQIVKMIDLARSGERQAALRLHQQLLPLTQLVNRQNPIAIKAALARLGLCHNQVRLPLLPLEKNQQTALGVAMANLQPYL